MVTTEPILAELVVPPPAVSPLRFGLRTLMAIMAVCSVQFALMSYLGVFAGFLVGVAVCCAAFTLVFLAGLCVFVPGHRQHLPLLDRFVVWLMLAMIVLMFGSMLAGGGMAIVAGLNHVRSEAWLRAQVGLSVRQTLVSTGTEAKPALEVLAIFPGSPADASAIRTGEYIMNFDTSAELKRILQRNRGQPVDLDISGSTLPGMVGPPRTVPLLVPK
jgi:hypothetical protein